jgi:3-isopropylmalate/(R)-2-methylmalate dehydratase small subunit
MKLKGKLFKFSKDVNTDEIIPARYLNSSDNDVLKLYCMEDLRPGFGKRDDVNGSIIVAGANFGCGSSREHAPISIKASGIKCVIAESFARIFFRNCINIGLPIIELADTSPFKEGNDISINFEKGEILDETNDKIYKFSPYPQFLQDIITEGGWLNYANKNIINNDGEKNEKS